MLQTSRPWFHLPYMLLWSAHVWAAPIRRVRAERIQEQTLLSVYGP